MTDAEKCRIHGWTVGTILEGDEGYGPDRIVLTAIGEERIYARQITENGEPCECREANWTLSCRDWKPVGFETAGFAQSEIEQLRAENEQLRRWYSNLYQAVWLAPEEEVEFDDQSAEECRMEAEMNTLASMKLRELQAEFAKKTER